VTTPPQASIIIPTRNRVDILRRSLQTLHAQACPLEIIVIDDASTDDTPRVVTDEFPSVHYQRNDPPRGPAVNRNMGADMANAGVLIFVDDDILFPDPDTVASVVRTFDDERVGAVTLPFVNMDEPEHEIGRAPDERVWVTAEYYGGMVAMRRSVYQQIGGYRSTLFMHVEEPDLTIRLYDAGYQLQLGTTPTIEHHRSPIRDQPKLWFLGARNHVLYAWYNVPLPEVLWHLPGSAAKAVVYAVKRGQGLRAMWGVLCGLGLLLPHLKHRRPVSRQTYRRVRRLRREHPVRADAYTTWP